MDGRMDGRKSPGDPILRAPAVLTTNNMSETGVAPWCCWFTDWKDWYPGVAQTCKSGLDDFSNFSVFFGLKE